MTRSELRRLVDELPEESVDAAGPPLLRVEQPLVAIVRVELEPGA